MKLPKHRYKEELVDREVPQGHIAFLSINDNGTLRRVRARGPFVVKDHYNKHLPADQCERCKEERRRAAEKLS